MAGEQEMIDGYIMRFAFSFTKTVATSTYQMMKALNEKLKKDHGEVDFKKLGKHHNITSELSEHIKDFELFEEYCKEHNIQYSLTVEDDGREYLWFKAQDQGKFQNFMQVMLSPEIQQEMLNSKAEGEVKQFLEEKTDPELIENYDELKETKEYKEALEKFKHAKEAVTNHFAEEYDDVLKELDLNVKSFNELDSDQDWSQLFREINKIDPNLEFIAKDEKIMETYRNAKVELVEVEDRWNEKQKSNEITKKYTILENPDKDNLHDEVGFDSFDELKSYLAAKYDSYLPQNYVVNNLQIDSISEAKSVKDIDNIVKDLNDKGIDVHFEKETFMNRFKRTKQKVQNELEDLKKNPEKTKELKKEKELVISKED